jgi:hypothetical protein
MQELRSTSGISGLKNAVHGNIAHHLDNTVVSGCPSQTKLSLWVSELSESSGGL